MISPPFTEYFNKIYQRKEVKRGSSPYLKAGVSAAHYLMNKTLEEWIALYNKKNYEEFKRDERFELFYLPEKGFAEIADTGSMIIVNQMCGEFKFWRNVAENVSRACGYKTAGTICIRPILPYIRLAGFEIDRIEETNLGNRYFCTDKHTGQKGQASPAGKDTWLITWEVTANGI